MNKAKIFICHYHKLEERKKYLDSILPTLDVPHEYSMFYTRENISQYEDKFSMDDDVINHKMHYMINKCGKKDLGAGIQAPVKALCLEHVRAYNKIVEEDVEVGIILEDDAVFIDNINEKLNQTIQNLPQDWDAVFLTNGCEGRPHHLNWGRQGNPSINNFVKMGIKTSWTAGAYMVRKEIAKKFAENIFPIVYPPDWEMNFLLPFLNCNTYWLEDPIVYEGSNPVSGKYFKYPSSVR